MTPGADALTSAPRPAPRRGRARLVPAGLICAATLVALGLALLRLDAHPFWDDEANTALFARNLLHSGSLTAWDGANLVAYRDGGELDEHLVNVYMPPLQYHVAALGMRVLGETTDGGRLPFVLLGVLAIPVAAAWAGRSFQRSSVGVLTAVLLAPCPAYLLYVRNCRYYSLGFLFLALVLLAVARPLGTRRAFLVSLVVGGVAMAALTFSQVLYAGALTAALPALFLVAELRTRRHVLLYATIAAVMLAATAALYWHHNPYQSPVMLADPTGRAERIVTLILWQLRELATGELLPLLLLPVFGVALLLPGMTALRPLARRALALVLLVLLYVLAMAAASPQTLITGTADIRYLAPLLIPGAALGAAALRLVWTASRPGALVLALATLFTNVTSLGLLADQSSIAGLSLGPRGVRCPICLYVGEAVTPYPSSTALLLEGLARLPRGAIVRFVPSFLTYPAMFYLPDLRYGGQLDPAKPIAPGPRGRLPSWIWRLPSPEPGEYFVLGDTPAPPRRAGVLRLAPPEERGYELVAWIDTFFEDRSRPEVMWHSYALDEYAHVRDRGISILRITEPPRR